MAILVLPEQACILEQIIPERDQDAMSFMPFQMNQIASVAVELIPNDVCPGIDKDLKGLIIACMAKASGDRPKILELHEFVRQAANDRDITYYQSMNDQENERRRQNGQQPRDLYNVRSETEQYTNQIIDILFTPPAAPPGNNA
ncbi:hypothetical protein F4680DRAFT_450153 [Xylaria scruposa]|nr:hypothetical protein F4680DRAFT_450153 [Xylaria scruposa]